VKERVPDAEHRLCARHIYANFKKRFDGEQYRNLFWAIVRSTTEQLFQKHMDEMKQLEPTAYTHLMDRNPKAWSRAFFEEGKNCDAMENGVSESFNNAIRDSRRKPIISMLEDIRLYVMQRMHTQRVMGSAWDLDVCPTIRRKLEKMKIKHR